MNARLSRFLCLLCYSLFSYFSQAQSLDLSLEDGNLKSIHPKESHVYVIELLPDEWVFVRFEQQGADIAIQVKDPEGKVLEEFDGNNGKQGPELVHIHPRIPGTYTLEVRPLDEQKKPGNYSVVIDRHLRSLTSPREKLDKIISYWVEQGYLPGFAVAVLNKDEILFQKAYGFAKLSTQTPYTLETIQNIGSVSKTLIGISLMKAVEDGKLNMDSQVNEFLPFPVSNPRYPNQPITLKHLATHTSSIAEMPDYEKSYILQEPFTYQSGDIGKGEFKEMAFYAKNIEQPLGDFLASLLSPSGQLYKKKHYLKQAPGEKYSYSNAAATLAAYIIERVYEMPYHTFTEEYILKPLGMKSSGWSFEDIEVKKHSDLHFFNQKPIPKYSLITYPDGGLLTNIVDLSQFLQSQMKGYYGKDQVITTAAYEEMMKPHLSTSQQNRASRNYGYFWEFTGDDIGHNGGDPGAVCFIRFNPESGIGRIIMTNIIPATPMANKEFTTIWRWLKEVGEEMK